MRKLWCGIWALVMAATMTGGVMAEPNIQQLETKKGIKVWLVESHQIPMVSARVTFRAGSSYEPAAQNGLASLAASLLDEGAGDLDALAFKEALDDIGARFGAGADKLDTDVNLTTLSDHKREAFRLMGLALNQPRFEDEDVERVKAAIIAGIRQSEERPGAVASNKFMKAVFGDHAYGLPVSGIEDTVQALDSTQLAAWHKAQFTKANMVVSIVGDITSGEAMTLVDEALGDLPSGTVRNVVEAAPSATIPQFVKVQKDVPQASVMVGHLGLSRDDKDYFPMLVMNEILGGGALTSRLGDEVREKNGLVYDVRSVNIPLPHAGTFYVQLQTENGKVQKALDLVKVELKRIKDKPVVGEEFTDAIDYLAGSFPLRIDSNAKILEYLALMQTEDLGADYLETWVSRVKAVTPADVQRVAKRLIHEDVMALTIVGGEAALQAKF